MSVKIPSIRIGLDMWDFSYLLTYDPIAFHTYLETILSSSKNTVSGRQKSAANYSPWLYMDAASIIFESARARCYTTLRESEVPVPVDNGSDEDEDALEAMDEAEGLIGRKKSKKKAKRKEWLPPQYQPVLEELPKWALLEDILLEIEKEIMARPLHPREL